MKSGFNSVQFDKNASYREIEIGYVRLTYSEYWV